MGTEEQTCVRDAERVAKIAELNDKLRKTATGGTIMLTRGVAAIPGLEVRALLAAVAAFDAFDDGNNPYGERDFGGVDFAGTYVLFKIDYYDVELAGHSPDAADPDVTKRVLTVMLPEEY